MSTKEISRPTYEELAPTREKFGKDLHASWYLQTGQSELPKMKEHAEFISKNRDSYSIDAVYMADAYLWALSCYNLTSSLLDVVHEFSEEKRKAKVNE